MKRHSTRTDSLRKGSFHWIFLSFAIVFALVLGCFGQQQQQQMDMQQQMQQMEYRIAELNTAFQENPRDARIRFQLAWAIIAMQGMNPQNKDLLKSTFDASQVDVPIFADSPMPSFLAAHLIGRYAIELRDSSEAQLFLQAAYNISRDNIFPDQGFGEICTHLQLATELEYYPRSNQDVDTSVANMEKWANLLIDLFTDQANDDIDVNWIGRHGLPSFVRDPYTHCMLNLFPLSFYYRADVAKIASLHHQLAALAFPKLLYTAQHVKDFDAAQQLAMSEIENPNDSIIQSCIDRKIRLGVVSSTLSEGHSVSQDFGGILQRLDRNLFDVSYHYVHENSHPMQAAAFLTANPTDRLFHYHKAESELFDGAWIRRIGEELEEFQFDMILYLDLTMSTFARRLGMERLAPVQLNTHGHPVTSGIPKEIMQHFVSWAEAELPLEESQTHYTEQLQLIPKGKIHQFYTPRLEIDPFGRRISRNSKQPFDHLTRNDFDELPEMIRNSSPEDENIHLYVCMQKPFKVFPEFDELVCGVLRDDPEGHAILHKETQTGHEEIFYQRLEAAGCDMNRVHFVSPQDHHRLMALYKVSTVILDSYPAGGCTTSREALELGKAIVTWPARLLGGRWTLGLYNAIGLDASSKEKVIANSKEEYIAKAVTLGTNKSLREVVERDILEALPNLFGREEAVEEWEKILLRVSPVKHCDNINSNDEL